MDYKRRFDARLDALTAGGNVAIDTADVAMDFMYGLNNTCYGEFKAKVVNNMQKGVSTDLGALNKMYMLASWRVVAKTRKDAGGATFITIDQGIKKGRGDSGKIPNPDKSPGRKTDEEKLTAKLAKMKCFNCREKGHLAKACTHKLKDDVSKSPMAGMTLDTCCTTCNESRLHKYYEVCIDNGSQVNIMDSRLLSQICISSKTYRSMNGLAETSRIGYLRGFFDCQACNTCPMSILSMADMEDLYPITYVQGEKITVHMDDRDLVITQ
jgi:hypothetical protein